jgi:hypothetical protein
MSEKPEPPAGEPNPQELLEAGAADGRACFVALVGGLIGMFACAVLLLWDGVTGRAIVGGAGFGLAGVVLPWLGEPRGPNQERFTAILSVIFGLGGTVLGAWAGAKGNEFPWWVPAGAVVTFGVAGGWIASRVHSRLRRSPRP